MEPIKSHKCFEGRTQFWKHDSLQTKTEMKFSSFTPAGKIKGGLIFLSGLTCTDENFITKAGAQKFASEAGLVLICPDTSPRGLDLPGEHDSYDFGTGAGFYLDALTEGYRGHYRMFSYLTTELYPLVQKLFKLEDRISITGHSMGGHGALVLGLREPDLFKSVSAFAPIANPVESAWGQKAFTGYLGSNKELWDSYDATRLVESGARHPYPILIDQGSKDEYLEKQLLLPNLIKACEAAGQELKAHVREDYDHSYYFISTFIESHIRFHAQALAGA